MLFSNGLLIQPQMWNSISVVKMLVPAARLCPYPPATSRTTRNRAWPDIMRGAEG
jgi:hypothetical protein